jgi:hypothetical protein
MSDRENSTTRPSELDMVRVRGRNEPGTVVHIYPHHLAYEVEFPDGVVTVDAEHVEGVAGLPHSRDHGGGWQMRSIGFALNAKKSCSTTRE